MWTPRTRRPCVRWCSARCAAAHHSTLNGAFPHFLGSFSFTFCHSLPFPPFPSPLSFSSHMPHPTRRHTPPPIGLALQRPPLNRFVRAAAVAIAAQAALMPARGRRRIPLVASGALPSLVSERQPCAGTTHSTFRSSRRRCCISDAAARAGYVRTAMLQRCRLALWTRTDH